MTYQVRPLTQEEITRFNVTEEEISKIRELMGDDAHRVTAPDVQNLRGLRGQDRNMGGLSLGHDPVSGFETFLVGGTMDRNGKVRPVSTLRVFDAGKESEARFFSRGFKIPAPPAEVAR